MSTSAGRDSDIVVTDYESWMLPQVAALFAAEYGGTAEKQKTTFSRFYDHPCQRDRAIRLVALIGETVVGFQSLFYWPYRRGDRIYRSYQSGRSLVSIDHRGKGIFGKLLGHLDAHRHQYDYDFLVGFPVEASFGSFLRNGWANPLDLTWRVRLLHPLSIVMPREIGVVGSGFDDRPEIVPSNAGDDVFELAEDRSFLEWRDGFSDDSNHTHFHYRDGPELVRFDCKPNRRGRISELIVGSVRKTTEDPTILSRALDALVSAARRNRAITMLSIASNARSMDGMLDKLLRRKAFIQVKPRIHFITKSFDQELGVNEFSAWALFRSDVDTW